MNQTNNHSAAPPNRDDSAMDGICIDRQGCKRPVALIAGDLLDLPPELRHLLRDCGCSALDARDVETGMDETPANPDFIIVNVAEVRKAIPDRMQALREKYGKPLVCVMPYPAEEEVARVAEFRADFIVFKPLCAEAFKSRIRILLWEEKSKGAWPLVDRRRRARRQDDKEAAPRSPQRAGMCLQVSQGDQAVLCAGERVRLTRKEYELLSLLCSEPGRVFSVAAIAAWLWSGRPRAGAADVHQCVHALRKKIEPNPRQPSHIQTVRSLGYRFAE